MNWGLKGDFSYCFGVPRSRPWFHPKNFRTWCFLVGFRVCGAVSNVGVIVFWDCLEREFTVSGTHEEKNYHFEVGFLCVQRSSWWGSCVFKELTVGELEAGEGELKRSSRFKSARSCNCGRWALLHFLFSASSDFRFFCFISPSLVHSCEFRSCCMWLELQTLNVFRV